MSSSIGKLLRYLLTPYYNFYPDLTLISFLQDFNVYPAFALLNDINKTVLKLYSRKSHPSSQTAMMDSTVFFGAPESEMQFGVASWYDLNKTSNLSPSNITAPRSDTAHNNDDEYDEEDFRENIDGVEINLEDAVDGDEDLDASTAAAFAGVLLNKDMENFKERACRNSVSTCAIAPSTILTYRCLFF